MDQSQSGEDHVVPDIGIGPPYFHRDESRPTTLELRVLDMLEVIQRDMHALHDKITQHDDKVESKLQLVEASIHNMMASQRMVEVVLCQHPKVVNTIKHNFLQTLEPIQLPPKSSTGLRQPPTSGVSTLNMDERVNRDGSSKGTLGEHVLNDAVGSKNNNSDQARYVMSSMDKGKQVVATDGRKDKGKKVVKDKEMLTILKNTNVMFEELSSSDDVEVFEDNQYSPVGWHSSDNATPMGPTIHIPEKAPPNFRKCGSKVTVQHEVEPRKLDFTTPPEDSTKRKKGAKGNSSKKVCRTPSTRGPPIGNVSRSKTIIRKTGFCTPRWAIVKFKCTGDMDLCKEEMEMSTYIFSIDQDESELLLKNGDTNAFRSNFFDMCPGKEIKTEMIHMVAKKLTWMQVFEGCVRTWCLPPQFAVDLLEVGMPIEDAYEKYAMPWMPPTDNLELRLGMSKILLKEVYVNNLVGLEQDVWVWSCTLARGIPNLEKGENSGVWVLEWLQMGRGFQPNLCGRLNVNLVRMRTCLRLVVSPFNELCATIQNKNNMAWAKWQGLTERLAHY